MMASFYIYIYAVISLNFNHSYCVFSFISDTLLALVLLSQYLPHDIARKTDGKVEKSWGEEEDLMVVLQVRRVFIFLN